MTSSISIVDLHCHLNISNGFFNQLPFFNHFQQNFSSLLNLTKKRRECLLIGISISPKSPIGPSIPSVIQKLQAEVEKIGKGEIKQIRSRCDLNKDFSIGYFFQIESARTIANQNLALEQLKELGVLGIIPVHLFDNCYGCSCNDPRRKFISKSDRGLSQEGYYFFEKLFELGMWIDVSHMSSKMTCETVKFFSGKILCSHTGIRALNTIERNICQETESFLKRRKGLIGITPSAKLNGLCQTMIGKTFDYYQQNDLLENICIGSDFGSISKTVGGVKNIFEYKDLLTRELESRGHKPTVVKGIVANNALKWLQSNL